MFMKDLACILFLNPEGEVGPSISARSSYVPSSFVCPSSVRVVATYRGTVLFPLLCSVLHFFA